MDCGQFDSVSESHRNAASTDDLIEAGLDKASEISSASDHVKYFGVLCCTDRTYCQDKKYLELDEILVRFDQALEDYCSQNSVNTWMGLRAATILESTMDHSNTTEFKNGVCSFLASNTTICFGSHGFRNELPVWQRMCGESKAANVKFLCSTNPRWYANMYAERNICDAPRMSQPAFGQRPTQSALSAHVCVGHVLSRPWTNKRGPVCIDARRDSD